jgi:hypothetical protein
MVLADTLASDAATLSAHCVTVMRLGLKKIAPELARSHAGAYAKASREIGLGREIQRDGWMT